MYELLDFDMIHNLNTIFLVYEEHTDNELLSRKEVDDGGENTITNERKPCITCKKNI